MLSWMIYGANGYTGELIAREAVARGMKPILAGRSENILERLGKELGCETRVFSLKTILEKVFVNLHESGVKCVLNCAGPFSQTARPLMEACLSTGVHYLDITGEIDVIEMAAALDQRAKQSGVALIPAVGFDVVPSDCLASQVCARLPDATHLQLAFTGLSILSPGTMKTTLENLPKGGRARIDGKIHRVPTAWKSLKVPFREGPKLTITIPWGDVASAFYSTGVPNIEVYATVSPEQAAWLRRLRWVLPLLKFGPLQRFLKRRIERTVRGPTAGDRAAGNSSLWCRATNDQGQSVDGTLTGPSAYELTVLTALATVEQVLGGQISPGFHTPSQAFGPTFINTIPGIDLRIESIVS